MDLKYKRDSFIKNLIDRLINHGFASFVCNVIYLISGEGLLHTKKKEKPCIDTQRNEVSGFTDGSHIYKMDFWGYKRVPFLRAFLKNELNMNAQVGYASGKV